MSIYIPRGPGRWWTDEELAAHDAALIAEATCEQGVKVILSMDEAMKVKAAMESVERLEAERDAAREQLDTAIKAAQEAQALARRAITQRDDATAEAAASQAIIESVRTIVRRDWRTEEGIPAFWRIPLQEALAAAPSAGEATSALTTDRAEKWDEGADAQFERRTQITSKPGENPYRVTPSTELNHTEEPPC